MRKIALVYCLLLNSILSFAITDTIPNKKPLFFGLNFSYTKLINEYRIPQPTFNLGGKFQKITGLNCYEFNFLTRIYIKDKFYIMPTFSFNNMNFLNESSYIESVFLGSTNSPPTKVLSVNGNIFETVKNLKLYLPVGGVKNLRKHILFFEAGLGINQVLSIKDELNIKVKLNTFNKTIEQLENLFLDSRGFYNNFNTRLFFRFSSGINFKIVKKLYLNTSVLLETTYFGKESDITPAPGIARITMFAFYPGFSVGLLFKK
jgi:hypothetical protein